jgi:hypothetical protein
MEVVHAGTPPDIDKAFSSDLWKNVEVANLSGGEPTTRNDMVEISRVMLDRFPRLRKFGINTTGLTPHRGIPMLTKVAEMCHERGIIFSTRVSIDGVGDMHNQVRKVKGQRRRSAPCRTSETRPISHLSTIFTNPTTRKHSRLGENRAPRHRLQYGSVHRADAREQRAQVHVRAGW